MPTTFVLIFSSRRRFYTRTTAVAVLALALVGIVPAFAQNGLSASAESQLRAIAEDKANWTPAQRKLDSNIIYNARVAAGRPAISRGALPRFRPGALERSNGRIHVDIHATVSQALLNAITAAGGRVESSFSQYNEIRAWIPLSAAETLAGRADVTHIRRAEQSITNSGSRPLPSVRQANIRAQLSRALPAFASKVNLTPRAIVGSDNTGVKAHGADIVQSMGITGAGVKIGVISDGVDSLAAQQSAGNLPTVTVIQNSSGDEGTAMLEIVHSMAPGAALYFATGDGGEASFAANILALKNAGCNIIVDDVTYFDEPVFQDGTISQAVNTVTAAGVMYFSSAANSGNLDSNTSGTWEGDFSSGGSISSPEAGVIHKFDATHTSNILTSQGIGVYSLKWAEPIGHACTDYDLYILDSTGTSVLSASTSRQSCSTPGVPTGEPDPIELLDCDFFSCPAGSKIIIVKFGSFNAATDTFALHLDTFRGRLSVGTSGATFGHNAAANTLTVAATWAGFAGGGIFLGGSQDPPETFSSDGPRKIFYDPSGNAITPGMFTFASGGGTTLNKVDFTAADGVPSGLSSFNPFFGTSAAAPHAAAIAALLKSSDSTLTNAQIISAMKSTALHVAAPAGVQPRTVGSGIVMATLALNSVYFPNTKITKSHAGNFTQGQTGATYSITVSNIGNAPLTGMTTVVDTLPSGLTATAIAGTNWSCVLATLKCTRSDSLAAGHSYDVITVTVNVSATAPTSVSNSAAVTNPNVTTDADDTANDPTTINQLPDLKITKSHTGNFTQGQIGATYTITVQNTGMGTLTGTTTVVDTLPAGLTALDMSGSGWACVLATLTCTRTDSLLGGNPYSAITLTVAVEESAPSSVTNTATVTNPNVTPDSDDTTSDITVVDQDLLYFLWFFFS